MREGRRGPRKGFRRLGREIEMDVRSVPNAPPKRLRTAPESAGWRMPTERGRRRYKRGFRAAGPHDSEVVFRKSLAAARVCEAGALLLRGHSAAESIGPI